LSHVEIPGEFSYFRKILVVAEDQGDIARVVLCSGDDIKREPHVDRRISPRRTNSGRQKKQQLV
jgi:hypothetical protein